ncbi:MAG: DUF1292 domain-containing protein [Lachnospiraceae bacterium]|nr:DUF1292 domain-containing protein [Lachnospiraceae bacterium]
MEKLAFTLDSGETVDFFILEQTRINNINYILVTDQEEGDGEALILKDLSSDEDIEANYEIVSEEEELNAVAEMFESLLDDIEFVTEEE